jgi:haloalkane dehalogenase
MIPHNDVILPQIPVLDSTMAYRVAGNTSGPAALFLHGNPTSSYIWRNILPLVAPVAHCIAPDLIGFGQSGKPDIDFRFEDHVRYLDAFLDASGIDSGYVIAQDWGTALAFELAARKPWFVRGLAFMEFIRPLSSWDHFHQSPEAREAFKAFRAPGVGEQLILTENVFVERVLTSSVMRQLTEQEMEVYRAPFQTQESRRPTWRFANELPIMGAPPDVDEVLRNAHAALRDSLYTKLLFVGDPGALVSPAFAKEFATTLKNCQVVNLGSGRHYLQEDHPEAIGIAVAEWIKATEAVQPELVVASHTHT